MQVLQLTLSELAGMCTSPDLANDLLEILIEHRTSVSSVYSRLALIVASLLVTHHRDNRPALSCDLLSSLGIISLPNS